MPRCGDDGLTATPLTSSLASSFSPADILADASKEQQHTTTTCA
jgi:hypothetical protein